MRRTVPMKKANLHNVLYLVIFIVCLVIILVFIGNASNLMKDKYNEEQCSSDIKAWALASAAGNSVDFNLRCQPDDIKIKGTDPEKIKRQLADSMLTCWNRFQRGEVNLFSNDKGSRENYCIICSYITFDKKGQKIENFLDFLLENKPIPNDVKIPQGTYFRIMFGQPETMDISAMRDEEAFIDTSQDYTTLFTYWKTVGTSRKADDLVSGAFTGFVGTGLGAVVITVVGSAVGIATGGVGFVALAALSGGAIFGISGAVNAPWDYEKEWSAGIFLTPFSSKEILEQGCTKLGS